MAAPTVASIALPYGTGVVNVDITGTNFASGAVVTLALAGQPTITATSVVVVSATEITCSLNLAGFVSGYYDVVVTNTDTTFGVLGAGYSVGATLETYYIQTLLIQYINKPNARATIGVLTGSVIASQVYTQVLNAFNIDTAVGPQLDMLGTYRGARRNNYAIGNNFFAAPRYTDVNAAERLGFATYPGAAPTWLFLRYNTPLPSVAPLDDATLRLLIQYLIAVQSCNYSLAAIDTILLDFFGAAVTMTDNEDMTVTYANTGSVNSFYNLIAALRLFPAPAGVEAFAL